MYLRKIHLYQFPEKSRQISVSSHCDSEDIASHGKLRFTTIVSKARAWIAASTDAQQWLQVDLRTEYSIAVVTRVKTQGRRGYRQWVTKYKIQYSHDGGETSQYYRDEGQTTDKVNCKYNYTLFYKHVSNFIDIFVEAGSFRNFNNEPEA